MKENRRFKLVVVAAALMLGPVMAGSVYASPATEKAVATAAAKVSLNKSDAKALMQIKGMSAYKAHAIVAYRKQNGDFKTMDDLAKVKGFKRIKPENMKGFTDQLMLD